MFTQLQTLSNDLAQNKVRDEQTYKIVEALENEVLKGNGPRPSMRSQLDLLHHRVEQSEKSLRAYEDTQRKSIVEVHQTHMSNRTKILLAILALVGTIATALATYESSKHSKNSDPQTEGR
jgi:hypothetical protein